MAEQAGRRSGTMITPSQHPQQYHRIYLAGSWKNQKEILLIRDILNSQGHAVDCFASEDNGRISFNWSKLDDIQDKLPKMDAKDMLEVHKVKEAFKEDKKWLDWCDLCILILPSGKSAHLEAGYAKGKDKIVVIFGDLQKGDFDVMYGFADGIFRCDEIDHMIDFVNYCTTHTLARNDSDVLDVKELFRKEIAKWKDEDPLFMAYVYGQEAGRKEERDAVLDIGEILESLCKTDLYWYNKGVTEGEDVGKCRGKDCNYCGRYNEKLRQQAGDPR